MLFFGPSIMTIISFREYKRSMERETTEKIQELNERISILESTLHYMKKHNEFKEAEYDLNFTYIRDFLDALEKR